MSNFPFTDVSQYDDIGVHNLWKELVVGGKVSAQEYLTNNALTSRDNSRTPMQWDTSYQAGFTKSEKPWLAVNPNYKRINVQTESREPGSVFSFYKSMIRLRRSRSVLVSGSYRDISGSHPRVYAYVRSDASSQAIVILNFSNESTRFELPREIALKRRVISNVPGSDKEISSSIRLSPWQSVIFE